MSAEAEEAPFQIINVYEDTEEERNQLESPDTATPRCRRQAQDPPGSSEGSPQQPPDSPLLWGLSSVALPTDTVQGEAAESSPSFRPGRDVGQPRTSPSSNDDVLSFLAAIPPIPEDVVVRPRAPRHPLKVSTLQHRKKIYAVAVSSSTRHVYTCGHGYVKVWDERALQGPARSPQALLNFPDDPDIYVHTCKLFPDERTLLTAGLSQRVTLWDLAPVPRIRAQLLTAAHTCMALALSADARVCVTCSRSMVEIWDVQNQIMIRRLQLPLYGLRCVDIVGNKFWTGGEDATVYSWDLRSYQRLQQHQLQHEVLSITHDPSEEWILAGVKMGDLILLHTHRKEKFKVMVEKKYTYHSSIKFASCGSFLVASFDESIHCLATPSLQRLFKIQDPADIVCCDVSSDNQYLVMGSGNTAKVYQLLY
ncbi:transducin-like enhancer protein 7 [Sorex fumeus]|uniref:transducin-like enhancer protein 7 n=1 Tax=Sorex fumeus TaxID=62283 RepID=UPI0024ADD985|nr:transducin-like enhancer protein 7 [Sorex fumeus]